MCAARLVTLTYLLGYWGVAQASIVYVQDLLLQRAMALKAAIASALYLSQDIARIKLCHFST
jgi:hypothetical protein